MDIEKDKKNLSGKVSVEHKECKGFQSKDYWEYKHHTSETHKIECKGCKFNLYGPATTMKTYKRNKEITLTACLTPLFI